MKSVSSGGYGGAFGPNSVMWGTDGLDYNREAGARWDSSIVFPILQALVTALTGIPLIIATDGEDEKPQAIPNHPLAELLKKPTPWYGGSFMQTAAIFQEGSRGNSYAYKHRSKGGKLTGIETLPEGACYPYTRPGSGDWITEYRIFTTLGAYLPVAPEDILHMRWMTPNPLWLQIGMSPIESCLPDLVMDKLAAKHSASILVNSAVSSLILSPKQLAKDDAGQIDLELTDTQATQIQRRIDGRLTQDGKGSSFAMNVPMDITQLGFDAQQMALIDSRGLSESRLCACFGGIPPVIVGFLIGLKNSNNRASYAAAVDQFYDAVVIPYMRHRAEQMTEDLIPELGNPGEKVCYDESKIPALKARLVRELIMRTGGPVETPNEGRLELKLPPVEGGDVLRSAKSDAGDSQSTKSDVRKEENDTTEDTA